MSETRPLEYHNLPPEQRPLADVLLDKLKHLEKRLDAADRSRSAEPWDHTPKPAEYWQEFRGHVIRLIERDVAIHWVDVWSDPWFQKQSHCYEPEQWKRARKKLVRGRHRVPGDDSDLVEFYVRGRGGRKWYLADWREMHCAAERAVKKERINARRAAQIVRRLREKWGATDEEQCARCRKDLEDMAK
jgi:hypothetical protein